MKRGILCTALLLALLLVCLVTLPTEADAATEGYYTYTVYNGEATIEDCNTAISGDIAIPSTLGGYPVTSIGNYAFAYCTSLTNITIPDSVIKIGVSAFDSCDNLIYTEYNNAKYLGNSQNPYHVLVEAISADITNCSINYNTKIIAPNAFFGCKELSGVVLPEGLLTIGEGAFRRCIGLTNITIPDSVTYIAKETFIGCKSLGNVTIGNGVKSIGEAAFDECYKLSRVTIPKSVTFVNYAAFNYCSNLQEVFYTGTHAQWDKIYFAAYNHLLFNAKIVYEGGKDTHTITPVEAKAATYANAGNTAYYICECGKYFSDAAGENEIAEGSWVIAALAAGKDTTALVIKPTASNTPATLMLGADLKLNFNVAVKTTTAYDSIFLEITKLGVTTEVELYSKSSTNHTFRYTLAAPEMTAEMKVVVCGEKNGKVYVGDPVTLTYKDIILSKLDSFYAKYDTDEQSRNGCHLLVNLLKYGEEAQKRFNISTDNLATAGLSDTYMAMINTAAPTLDTWVKPAKATYYLVSYTPMLQEQIKIAFTFAVPSYTSLEGYEVRIVQTKSTGVVTHTFGADVLKNTGSTRIRCDFAIAGAEGRDNLAITLYKDGAAVSATVNTNLSALSQGKLSDALNPLLYAMMNYCDAAKAFFG